MRLAVTTILLLLGVTALADAQELRIGIMVGNNRGSDADGSALRFAQRDATEMAEVLVELGGFSRNNLMVVKEGSPNDVRAAFAKALAQVEGASKSPSARSFFLFFFSGHAGCDGLHLGDELLTGRELKELVKSVEANIKVAIVDACHAGTLAYLKGATPATPFLFDTEALSEVEGTAYVMSCGQSEKAQESPELEHSVFSYWLLSALRGAADYSGDGRVTLPEAWEYVKNGTTLTSTRTGIPQRPMWDVNIKGQEDVCLTSLHDSPKDSAVLEFPAGGDYWIFRDDRKLVAEVHALLPGHRIALAAGNYLVRRIRDGEALLEQVVTLSGGDWKKLALAEMDSVPYARLVAKGTGRPNRLRHGPLALVSYRGETLQGFGGMLAPGVAWPVALGKWWISPRFQMGGSSFEREEIGVNLLEFELSGSVGYGFDFDWLVLRPQVTVGGFLGYQRIGGAMVEADTRTSLGLEFGGGLSLMLVPFDGRAVVEITGESANFLYRHQEAGGQDRWRVTPTYRITLGLGYVL